MRGRVKKGNGRISEWKSQENWWLGVSGVGGVGVRVGGVGESSFGQCLGRRLMGVVMGGGRVA